MKCGYRKCTNDVEQKAGRGRNRHFCSNNCKSMEVYYRGKESEIKRDPNASMNTVEKLNDIYHAVATAFNGGFIDDNDAHELTCILLGKMGFIKEIANKASIEGASLAALVDCAGGKREDEISYVYIMDCGDIVKIGKSKDPHFRCKTLAKTAGRRLLDTHFIKFDNSADAFRFESEVHNLLSEFRCNGEWFNLGFEEAKGRVTAYAETVTFARLEG